MKKLLILAAPLALMLSSCYTIHGVTNNPVGNKEGTAKAGMFSTNADFSYNEAAKSGNVDKIATWEIKKNIFSIKTTVTGQ